MPLKDSVALLKANGRTIGTIESLTAGLFAKHLGEIPGVSKVFAGSVVTYMTRIKTDVVHVSKEVVEQYGVVSGECAKEMAEKGKELLEVDYCVSFTGNAGPDVMENKPVGLVYTAIAGPKQTVVMEHHLNGTRNEIREAVCEKMFTILEKEIRNQENSEL